ncbi:hypothetical protein GCM10007918_43800 [Piscinibacter gummiphilus]|nr:hypothetical protein GCM10007918_43800 [Piscinibacter gummiphilus]
MTHKYRLSIVPIMAGDSIEAREAWNRGLHVKKNEGLSLVRMSHAWHVRLQKRDAQDHCADHAACK